MVMKRLLWIALLLPVSLVSVRAANDPGAKASIAYVQKLQTSTGGFLAMAPQPNIRLAPTLRSTSAAVRALHYLGGEIPNKEACIKYVESCFDPASGGFADMPMNKPDIFTTAVGIMAVTELKMPLDKYNASVTKYLSENAKTFEDIRIAAAGLERLGAKSPRSQSWLEEVRKAQNSDGTFGKDLGQARFTGGAVVTLLRLGGKVDDPATIIKTMQAGQRPSGGFGKEDSPQIADLETSYRIMRCFVMLKARPSDVEGLRSFVAKCRNEDGGYGISPGQPSNVGATYFAAILKHWLDQK
jgi:hypothetical protein